MMYCATITVHKIISTRRGMDGLSAGNETGDDLSSGK